MTLCNGYRRVLLWTGVAFTLGCGLSEYQSKYEKQQERMNYLDQENLYLVRPQIIPPKKETNEPHISLRLPVGISTKPDEEPMGILHRYPKSAAKPPRDTNLKFSEIESVLVAVERSKNWKEFKKRVLEPFNGVEPENTRPVSLEIPGRPPRTFEKIAFTEGMDPTWTYQFYFFQDPIYHVAIGFRGSESGLASDTARQALEFCIKSLVLDAASSPSPQKSSGS